MQILKIFTKQRITGNVGEAAVCKYLKRKRYKIAERNYVENGHEIDIIAESKEYICFVEVKTRTVKSEKGLMHRPREAVTRDKQRAIVSAAKIYEALRRHDGKKFRFDVAEVYLSPKGRVQKIEYIEGAYDALTPYRRP